MRGLENTHTISSKELVKMNYKEYFIKWLKKHDYFKFINHVIHIHHIKLNVLKSMFDMSQPFNYISILRLYNREYGYFKKIEGVDSELEYDTIIETKLNELELWWHIELYRHNPNKYYNKIRIDYYHRNYQIKNNLILNILRYICDNEKFPSNEELEKMKEKSNQI